MRSIFFKKKGDFKYYNYHVLKVAFIHISDLCNFRCQLCRLPKIKKQSIVSLTKIKEKIETAKQCGFKNIIFTGQEIILHPNIDTIIKFAFDNIKFDSISIVSNGLALSNSNIFDTMHSIKMSYKKFFLGVSVNFYDAKAFSSWSGRNQKDFQQWSLGFKKAVDKKIVSYIDIILKKDIKIIKILNFLSQLTGGLSKKINLRIGELMPLRGNRIESYEKLKFSLSQIPGLINVIRASHCGQIEFEGFPTCIFNQNSLKRQLFFICNFNLYFEKGLPIQYDPLLYESYFNEPTENWLIDKRKLISVYEKIFTFTEECKDCYYRYQCCGITRIYEKIHGKEKCNQEIQKIKKNNWK